MVRKVRNLTRSISSPDANNSPPVLIGFSTSTKYSGFSVGIFCRVPQNNLNMRICKSSTSTSVSYKILITLKLPSNDIFLWSRGGWICRHKHQINQKYLEELLLTRRITEIVEKESGVHFFRDFKISLFRLKSSCFLIPQLPGFELD